MTSHAPSEMQECGPENRMPAISERYKSGNPGVVTTPRGVYIRALEFALGEPIENLGFVPADEKYGLDRENRHGD